MLNAIQDDIKKLLNQLNTEHSVFEPTAYATAWVCRVPAHKDLAKPAFPQALNWLRNHQLADGGWGSAKPCNPFANTLATLAAILALKQWGLAEDKAIIIKAINALDKMAAQLNQAGAKTFGFELILAALIEEAQSKNIPLTQASCNQYQPFVQMGNAQREMLKGFFQQTLYQNPNVFWLCLEMLGGNLLTDTQHAWPFATDVIADNGSLLASVAASAYFLTACRYRGQDVPIIFEYLNELIAANNSGVPPYHPMEGYETAFALDFLLKGGVPVETLQPGIGIIKSQWQQRNGLGYSLYSPSLDADDSALGLIILKAAGMPVDYRSLLEFFNGDYFMHYREDPTPSVSVNANVLRALLYFKNNADVKPIIEKVHHWIKNQFATAAEQVFHDSWHLSPYYAASAISFALMDFDESLHQYCIDWLIKQQKNDGGWGYDKNSTAEETALAVLALAHPSVSAKIDIKILQHAKNYLNLAARAIQPAEALYMGTTMVYPKQVVRSTILAAQYRLATSL